VDGNGVIVYDDDELRTIQNVILFLCLFIMFPEKNDVMMIILVLTRVLNNKRNFPFRFLMNLMYRLDTLDF
jgi:hypothetical protein